jgi:predicted O-linked N-acetylglucosamine transferase (SPINDLY family)
MIDSNITFQQAYELHQQRRHIDALKLYSKILKSFPNHLGALTMFGMLSIERSSNLEGIKSLEKSLKIDPMQFWAVNALGVGYLNLKQYKIALTHFLRAIEIKIDFVDAYFNLGKTYRLLNRFNDSLEAYSQCLRLNSLYAEAYLNRGNVYLEDLDDPILALEDFDQFLKLIPGSFFGYSNKGNALNSLRRFDEAVDCFDHAIMLKPDYAEAYVNKGNALNSLRRFDEAVDCFDHVIMLKPDYAEVYVTKGIQLIKQGSSSEALFCFRKAFEIKPNIDYLLGHLLSAKMALCDWDGFEHLLEKVKKGCKENKKIISPLALMGIIDAPDLHKNAAHVFSRYEYDIKITNNEFVIRNKPRTKVRLGYFSADYHNHPVLQVTRDIYKHHDKDRFEVYAFSFGIDVESEYKNEIFPYLDKFIDVSDLSDEDVAKLSRDMEIDIAINLNGYTQNERTSIFAHRAAPVQINYLGFPGTMGVDYIDYIIADKVVLPEMSQKYYNEDVLYLPNTFFPNVEYVDFSKTGFDRRDFGLPEDGFVFCTFNNVWKITPEMFELWMKILNAVPGSVLWFSKPNQTAEENLYQEAERKGINRDRLIPAPRLPDITNHFSRIQCADLFLDTFPYGGHTTASDMLRAGIPIVTLIGQSFASRVAASMLSQLGLNELITSSKEEYRALAIDLATNPNKLAMFRDKLSTSVRSSTLFDSKQYTRDLEGIYKRVLASPTKPISN